MDNISNTEDFINCVGIKSFFVMFQKKNGETRKMHATLCDPSTLTEKLFDLSLIDRSKDYVRVYDTENKGWRTIKINSLLAVRVNQ